MSRLSVEKSSRPLRPVPFADLRREVRDGELVTVAYVEEALDAEWPQEPKWLLFGTVVVRDGEPVVESYGVKPNRWDSRSVPHVSMPQHVQRKVTPARLLKAFRWRADEIESLDPATANGFDGCAMLKEHGFDPDAATAPVAPQRRGLGRHAELIRRVVELSDQGVDHPMPTTADELHVGRSRVRGIMRDAYVAGVVDEVEGRPGHYTAVR